MSLPLTVSCFSKIQIGFTFLVPGSPGKRSVKRVCVCECEYYYYYAVFNAPRVGHKDNELQARLCGFFFQQQQFFILVSCPDCQIVKLFGVLTL